MNSYPSELLTQLAPLMFVAGLDTPPDADPSSSKDSFVVLATRLREALTVQRKVAVWQPEKSKSFHVVFVDKAVRFPPRKIVPEGLNLPPHSPLSPLVPTSPLHPDGLIAPIWIRKHTALVPSVFILFLRIYESPPHIPTSPLDPPPDNNEKEDEERRRDAELSSEIATRKKSTNERGIKLTVVLMATRKLLDDPTLDTRLSYIRRQSGLDSRAALFVLSPVSPAELGEFVRSIQQALYDPAVEYYTNHSKRVRRKRNRNITASSVNVPPSPLITSNFQPRPLRPEGWTVRYEYKMACFAEFRGEDEVALKHYQDSYNALLLMFGNAAILPPRTKRWAEAKVLADCINLKICKLYLYNAEHSLALSHHIGHIQHFADFSRGWGIGEETFEFWSWIARQYRIFADLVEQGTHAGLTIPTHLPAHPPPPPPRQPGMPQLPPGMEDTARVLGLNPSHALQHPGFYYWMAAAATEKRRETFLNALEADPSRKHAPGFANEQKVDHLTAILELYTKAYELFKKYSVSSAQGRLTLWIALRIAQTYYASEKYDTAVKFFERIAKTYRRERWGSVLRPLLETWKACAKQMGDTDTRVQLVVELLAYSNVEGASVENELIETLKSSGPSAEAASPFVVDLTGLEPILDTRAVFWSSELTVSDPAAFQLHVACPAEIAISSLPISSMTLHFTSQTLPVIRIQHIASETEPSPVRCVSLGELNLKDGILEKEADLRWKAGETVIFIGTLLCENPQRIEFSKVTLTLKEGDWVIDVPFSVGAERSLAVVNPSSESDTALSSRWLSSIEPIKFISIRQSDCSSVTVRPRPHLLALTVTHSAPAYVGETFPLEISVTNIDTRTLDVRVNILLHPSEDDALNEIAFGNERSTSMIKGVDLGRLNPGVSTVKTLFLTTRGSAEQQTLDVSIQSYPPSSSPTTLVPKTPLTPRVYDSEEDADKGEILETIIIPVVAPFKYESAVAYQRRSASMPLRGLADMRSYDPPSWTDKASAGEVDGEATVKTTFECVGPWDIWIEKISLVREDVPYARALDSTLEMMDLEPEVWHPGDEIGEVARIGLLNSEDRPESFRGPGHYNISWRRCSSERNDIPFATTTIPLPILQPPSDGLVALVSAPASARLHSPILMTMTIRNNDPSRTAVVTVQVDNETGPDGPGFVVAGLRSGRVPLLLPGTEEVLHWRLIPLVCGSVRLPRLKVLDVRKAVPVGKTPMDGAGAADEGDPVNLVNVRWDDRRGDDDEEEEVDRSVGFVFVLPP